MKKKSLIIAMFAMFAFLFLGFFSKSTVSAKYVADSNFMLFIACPGEDSSTQMNFSWHSDQKDSYVEIVKKSDGNFDKAIKVYPKTMTYTEAYPFAGTNWGVEYPDGIDKNTMFVCEAFATGLEPSTEYMYRGWANNKYTEVRNFKTAGNDGVFVFAVMADPQIYAESLASNTVNSNMNKAMANAQKLFGMDVELVLGAGDMFSHGGLLSEVNWLFSLVDIFKNAPLAASTGNHDYCDAGNGKVTIGPYLTDNVYNNPRNGCEGYGEACYYFKWNNVLFAVLDSEVGTSGYINQGEWLKQLLATETYQYVVTMCHRPAWGSGDSANVVKYWDPIFKQFNVDLFFAGHNHDYGRGSTKVGAERGQKKFPNNYICCDDTYNAPNGDGAYGGYCLVKVTPTNLFFYAYDQYDNCRDQYVFASQRTGKSNADFSKDTFMNSFKVEVVETDSTKVTLSWEKGFADNVAWVRVLDNNEKEVANAFTNSESVTSLVFGGLKANESYSYKVRVEFKDGTTETKDIAFATRINYGSYTNIEKKELSAATRLLFNPSDIKSTLLEKVNVYIDGALKAEYEPGAKYVALEKELLTDAKIIELKGVVKSDKSEVLLGTYNLVKVDPVLTVDTKDFEIEEGEESKIKASVDQEVKIIYSSSDNSILTVDENGVVKAIKAGTAQVIVSIEGTEIKKEIKVTVKAKQAETKELETPVIKIENGKLIITKVEGTTKYEIYINGSLKETIEGLEVELSKYNLSEGEYKLTVKALGNGETILDSKMSNEATYKVEKSEEPTPKPTPEPSKKGCNGGSYQAIWYVVSLLGLAVVLKKKRLF